jgi:hypothetical protein
VKNWFQAFAFKFNLRRYSVEGKKTWGVTLQLPKAGLNTLTHSLKAPGFNP